jgi:uncharacterized protein
MQCPICHVDLLIAERQGIEIDYCPQCRGVWLDRGELDKIIERARDEQGLSPREETYSPPHEKRKNDQPYVDDDDGGERYDRDPRYTNQDDKRRPRGSFLDDIFDIFD